MKHSEGLAKVSAALVAAQKELKAVGKDSVNPHFKNKYASLDNIIDAVRPVLGKHGLAVIQSAVAPETIEGRLTGFAVETMLVHESGEWIANAAIVPVAKADPQGAGGALTYGRRYGLSALLSLSSDEDDDGNAASKGRSAGVPTQQRRTSAPSGSPATVADTPAPVSSAPATSGAAKKHMPFGKHKGKELGEISSDDLVSTVKWCREKGKYDDLVEACNEVLELRQEQLTAV